MSESATKAAAVVSFWREAGEEKWFRKDDSFDHAIGERFGSLHAKAAGGELSAWRETPEGALALILILDQFSRNLFRGSPKTFAQDAMAVELAQAALDAGFERGADPALRMFFYMPFMHSESIADQQRCIALCHRISGADSLKYACEHRDIIRRFGRFPHRNAILGRHTSAAEQAFLDGGGFAG